MNEQRTAQPPAAAGLLYTALQLSRGLGVTPQAIRNRLANVGCDGQMLASGNLTAAWRLESLPAGLLSELEQAALKAGYHLVDHFLRAKPAPQPRDPKPPVLLARPSDERFRDLLTVLQAIRDPSAPSLADKAFVWGQAVELYQALGPGRKLKRDLLRFLNRHAPWLARNSNALRVAFERRLKDPAAVTDRRPEANAKRRLEVSQADIDTLVTQGVFETGRYVSQAWRECRQEGTLTPDLANRQISNPACKSDVPKAVRRAVSTEIRILHKLHKAPRQWEAEGDYVDRNMSRVFAGDWYQGDDKTPDVYFYEGDGLDWFTMLRGQFLPMMDWRCRLILVARLIARETYDALDIRSTMDASCREYGVPRKGFYFERGPWARSLIVKGLRASAVPWSETASTFGRLLNVKFRHAQKARGKAIENVFRQLDRKMFGEPGYCGPDEQHDKYERVQKALRDVKARRLHPAEAGFWSYDQWCARLAQIVDEYNAEGQGGQLDGLSPNAAWQAFQNSEDPVIEYDERCALACASERFPVKVGRGGRVRLPFKRHWVFKSPKTRMLEGQRLLAWICADEPDVITLTDLRSENPLSVPRVDPSAADNPEEIGSALALIQQGNRICRARYLKLKKAWQSERRRNIVSPDLQELNRAMVEQHQAIRQEESARASRDRRLTEAAREVGLSRGALNRDTEQALEATRDLARGLAALENEEGV